MIFGENNNKLVERWQQVVDSNGGYTTVSFVNTVVFSTKFFSGKLHEFVYESGTVSNSENMTNRSCCNNNQARYNFNRVFIRDRDRTRLRPHSSKRPNGGATRYESPFLIYPFVSLVLFSPPLFPPPPPSLSFSLYIFLPIGCSVGLRTTEWVTTTRGAVEHTATVPPNTSAYERSRNPQLVIPVN